MGSTIPSLFIGTVYIAWQKTGLFDIITFCLFVAIRRWETAKESINTFANTAFVTTLIALVLAFVLFQTLRFTLHLTATSTPPLPTSSPSLHGKPMLFPCQTGHTRFFPKKRSFKYSYFQVGIPVGWKGSLGGLLSADVPADTRSWYRRIFSLREGAAWMVVNGDDYLGRGHSENGLRGKLDEYLVSQSIDPSEFPNAYLHTAPRFLNYSSNPVSIWNLYSPSNTLAAVILEVNNTFDERHIYFLRPASSSSDEKEEREFRYTGTWPKDFYVSVFNDRTGAYSLSATSPLPSYKIDATVTLSTIPPATTTSTKDQKLAPMLTARLLSTSALDPSTLSLTVKLHFLLKYSWIGLLTFPRTIAQALTIVINHLPWVFRPEPRKDTMSRPPTTLESTIEAMFESYLKYVVDNHVAQGEALNVTYTPPSGPTKFFPVVPAETADSHPKPRILEFRVLTPLFYSRFIQHPDTLSAFTGEIYSQTISISLSPTSSSTKDLDQILSSIFSPQTKTLTTSTPIPKPTSNLSLLAELRRTPAPILCAQEPKTSPAPVVAERRGELSDFENYILASCSPEETRTYTDLALPESLASHVALGIVELLSLELFVVKLLLIWGLTSFV